MKTNTHIFALYCPSLPAIGNNQMRITQVDLVHRISRVLRLSVGDICILFDAATWVELSIVKITRDAVTCTMIAKHDTTPWHPKITFFLPLLKRESLATALYNLVQAGVQEIQLMITDKTPHSLKGAQKMEHLERIVIAAAEQSKNFAFPIIKEPITFQNALAQLKKMPSYVGDPSGTLIFNAVRSLTIVPDHCGLLVGPEGDLTPQEWAQLHEANVISVQLTPTVLKAETAAFYLAAFFRAFFSQP